MKTAVSKNVSRLAKTMVVAGAMVLSGAASVQADVLDDIREAGVLRFGTEMQYPPFDMIVDGDYQGVSRDMADAIAAHIGVEADYTDLPWASVLPGLEAGRFDVVNAPVTITSERQERYAFTIPFAIGTVGLVKRAGDDRIAEPTDIAGLVVGGQKASSQFDQLKDYVATLDGDTDLREYVDNNQAYSDLLAGRVDAVVGPVLNLAYLTQTRTEFEVVQPAFGTPTYFSMALRLEGESESLKAAIDDAIKEMHENGELARIQEKWFGTTIELPTEVPEPKI
ncbi:MAG: transporter substrate-binding domain-containing protein [Pseudomonadota bacterium]